MCLIRIFHQEHRFPPYSPLSGGGWGWGWGVEVGGGVGWVGGWGGGWVGGWVGGGGGVDHRRPDNSPYIRLIVECPMIDHVRWPITHFVRHPLNHVDDVMRCFCSIFNHWSLVARAATCGIFLLKSNDVQTRNLSEGHFLCAFTYIPSIALA